MTRAPDTIAELMSTDVVTVGEDDPVREALQRMVDHDIGSVLVMREGSPVGIFTERDVTRHLLGDVGLLEERVGDLMSSPLISARPSDEVVDTFQLMNDRGIRRLPVIEGERLVGIVTEGDLRRWVGQVARE